MNSKKRLIISITAVCIVATIGILVIITLLMMSRCTPESENNINTDVTTNGVYGEVSANAIFAGEIHNMTTDGQFSSSRKIVYNGEEGTKNKLIIPNIDVFTLTERFNYLVLEYKFTNTSSTDDWIINLDTTLDRSENIELSIVYNEEGLTDFSLIDNQYTDDYISNLPVGKNSTMLVYIKISVADINKSADFETNFVWTINSRSFQNKLVRE